MESSDGEDILASSQDIESDAEAEASASYQASDNESDCTEASEEGKSASRMEVSSTGQHQPDTSRMSERSFSVSAGGGGSIEEDETEDMERRAKRQANIDALTSNSLVTCRKPMMPKMLNVEDAQIRLKKPFKSPKEGAPRMSLDLRRRLAAKRNVVPWGSGKPFRPPASLLPTPLPLHPIEPPQAEEIEEDNGVEPLVLWEPDTSLGEVGTPIEVDKRLTKFLRPHQREGVAFMFECVAGIKDYEGQGCILADDMGLGKTLQGIALMWTVLKQGAESLGGVPLVKRTIIVCPTSLVSNWDSECEKWLKGSVRTIAMSESSRDEVIHGIDQFLHDRNPYHVLIISYETFRIHSAKFNKPESCDLLICDEAHRLKNDNTLTNKALDRLHCKRRVLLSGTPLQNHLEEFYAMVNFCNPGVLGTPSSFRRQYETAILAGREPDASDEEVSLGQERSEELSGIVNQFILRRTNKLLSAHLPPKVVEVVCCRLTPIQESLYCHFLQSTAAKRLLKDEKAGKSAGVLSAITSLKKLCNHPKLIYDAMHSRASNAREADGFKGCEALFPPGIFNRGNRGGMPIGWEEMSGKMSVLARMMAILKAETKDRIVVVSNYTQTLDLVGTLCREKNYPFLRLDGSTSITKRQKLVLKFNDPKESQFAFLLSSKAGGCGLNLIGGNRLVLFDPDWNPANDKQAAARVWRDGQKKRVYVYRFLSTGTIEEKVFQRQLSKEGLQGVVNQSGRAGASLMSSEALRDLFTLNRETPSDTYESMRNEDDSEDFIDLNVENQEGHTPAVRKQVGNPSEEDLENWGRHFSVETVPDEVMHRAAGGHVSFVFTCEIDGKPIEEETSTPPAISSEQASNQAATCLASFEREVCKKVEPTPRTTLKRIPLGGKRLNSSLHSERSLTPLQPSSEDCRKRPKLSSPPTSTIETIEVLDSDDDTL
ncbi:hypothetical protein BSKO_02190 [Bryopsis sp. KO-2023]|nr:hypothetical protein BSKO_02190 [Bryopsis sp. KO-2023]